MWKVLSQNDFSCSCPFTKSKLQVQKRPPLVPGDLHVRMNLNIIMKAQFPFVVCSEWEAGLSCADKSSKRSVPVPVNGILIFCHMLLTDNWQVYQYRLWMLTKRGGFS